MISCIELMTSLHLKPFRYDANIFYVTDNDVIVPHTIEDVLIDEMSVPVSKMY